MSSSLAGSWSSSYVPLIITLDTLYATIPRASRSHQTPQYSREHHTDIQLLGLLIFEVFITLRSYGGDIDTWKTPFNELVTNGAPARHGLGVGTGTTGTGIGHHKTETTTVGGPSVVQNNPAAVQNV